MILRGCAPLGLQPQQGQQGPLRADTCALTLTREGAVPYADTAWCLGGRTVSRRLSQQQLLSLQPQVLVTAPGPQRGVCGRPSETPEALGGPVPGTDGRQRCTSEPPRQRLPGCGPAHLEGNAICWSRGGKLCRHIGGLGPRSSHPWLSIPFPCSLVSDA